MKMKCERTRQHPPDQNYRVHLRTIDSPSHPAHQCRPLSASDMGNEGECHVRNIAYSVRAYCHFSSHLGRQSASRTFVTTIDDMDIHFMQVRLHLQTPCRP